MPPPVAPKNITLEVGEMNMAAASVHVIPRQNKTFYERLIRGIAMTVQKANSPTVTISPTVIGLLLTIAVQLGVTIWWASGISKDLERNKQDVIELKSTVDTQKVYIDNYREKQVKLEAAVENLEKQQQQLNILIQMKGAK